MSQAIDTLKHEHDAILMALRILEQIAARANEGRTAPKTFWVSWVSCGSLPTSAIMERRKACLFPAMVEAGLLQEGGPIAVMLAEHARGRDLVAAMASAIEPEMKPAEFAAAAGSYVDHLRAHIDKENEVLFPIAERILSAEDMDRLAPAFERHEDEVIGHGRHEELHAMLSQLKAKYLGR